MSRKRKKGWGREKMSRKRKNVEEEKKYWGREKMLRKRKNVEEEKKCWKREKCWGREKICLHIKVHSKGNIEWDGYYASVMGFRVRIQNII